MVKSKKYGLYGSDLRCTSWGSNDCVRNAIHAFDEVAAKR